MGTIGARKAREILENARKVLAMELLAACQGIDLRGKRGLGDGSKIAYEIVRNVTDKIIDDVIMYKEINKCEHLIKTNEIVNKVEKSIGDLK